MNNCGVCAGCVVNCDPELAYTHATWLALGNLAVNNFGVLKLMGISGTLGGSSSE